MSIAHSGSTATVKFKTDYTSGFLHFGIRDVYIIAKRCHSDCLTCTGYDQNMCNTCSETTKRAPFPSAPNYCKCTGNYYQ